MADRYEIDNLGFNVYREINGVRTNVNASLIAGSGLQAGQGAAVTAELRYALWDTGSVDPSAVYWLEDLDFNAGSTWHGPVTPVVGGLEAPPGVPVSTVLTDLGKSSSPTRRPVFLEQGGGLNDAGRGPRAEASATERQWALAARFAVKIGIKSPRVVSHHAA